MEDRTKRRRPDEQVEERRPKRRTTNQPSPDEPAGHTTERPISGARSEFHGQGVQNSGAFHVGRDLNIGDHNRSDQDSRFLADLRSTDPRDDKSRIERTKGGLLRDSYRWILDHNDFHRWRDDAQSRLLWIKGDPGKGKTMLLCGIIDELETLPADSRLLSYFFCQVTDARLNNAMAVLRGLIYLLLDQKPSLISDLRKKYDHAGKPLFEDVNSWDALSKMLFGILQDPSLHNTYLVVDALDECETGLDQLLHLVVQVSLQSRTKMIVSSRNWPNIEDVLSAATQKVRLCLELNEKSISAAVSNYIEYKVDQLARSKRYDNITRDAVRQHLASNANDTFLWVALVCQELANPNVRKWHTRAKLTTFPPGLDSLYRRMMNQISRSDDAGLCRQVLGLMSVVYRPLALTELTSVIESPEEFPDDLDSLEEVIGLCGSLLALREGVIFFVHQSAKDFLLKSASHNIHPHGIAQEHRSIVARSLQVMSKTLRRDIYNLCTPGISIDKVKPPDPDPLAPARYSCVYWVDHLVEGDLADGIDVQSGELVSAFLEQHFLHWLEGLALLGRLSDGAMATRKVLETFKRFPNTLQKLRDFMKDAIKVISSFGSIIARAPLQTYSTLLLFSPVRSEVRQKFWSELWPGLKSIQGVKSDWDAHQQTLEGHSGAVMAVAFSPDGQLVASASHDETVRLWDTTTGTLRQTLEGHNGWVSAVAFSPDGQLVASASDDETVRLWDTTTGTLQQTIETGNVGSLRFDPTFDMRLCTDIGNLDIVPVSQSDVAPTAERKTPNPAFSGFGLNPDRNWIMKGTENLVWLPPEYRPTASAVSDSTICIGCASGRVIRITTA